MKNKINASNDALIRELERRLKGNEILLNFQRLQNKCNRNKYALRCMYKEREFWRKIVMGFVGEENMRPYYDELNKVIQEIKEMYPIHILTINDNPKSKVYELQNN